MQFGKALSFHTFIRECEPFSVGESKKLSSTRFFYNNSLDVGESTCILGVVDVRHSLHFGQSLDGYVVFLNQSNWKRDSEHVWKEKGIGLPVFAFVDKSFKKKQSFKEPKFFPWIWVEDTYALLVHVLNQFKSHFLTISSIDTSPSNTTTSSFIHPTAIIEGYVEDGACIGAGCYIGKNSLVKKGSILEPCVTVLENCFVGENSTLQSGVVVGCAGFGFYDASSTRATSKQEEKWKSIPHLAGVYIGKEVWLGANTVVAAGVLHPTVIEDHCKLDSHIQVAHNVHLGAGSRMSSQSGIAGSTYIGKNFLVGGGSSISDHLNIGDDVTVAARSGVTKNVTAGEIVGGYPAQPLYAWKKQVALLKQWVQKGKKRRPYD